MIGSSLVLQGSVHCMEILPMSYMGVYKDTSIWSDTSMEHIRTLLCGVTRAFRKHLYLLEWGIEYKRNRNNHTQGHVASQYSIGIISTYTLQHLLEVIKYLWDSPKCMTSNFDHNHRD